VDAFSYVKEKVLTSLKPSRVSGIGVFALVDIEPGIALFDPWLGKTGLYPIPETTLRTLPNSLYRHIKDIFLYGPDFPSDSSTYIKLTNGCHWVYTTPYYFINSGGSKANVDKDTNTSTRFIKAGEELLSNYKRYERYTYKDLL
jgi:hypothetical protein